MVFCCIDSRGCPYVGESAIEDFTVYKQGETEEYYYSNFVMI